jgi:hypothetical protein
MAVFGSTSTSNCESWLITCGIVRLVLVGSTYLRIVPAECHELMMITLSLIDHMTSSLLSS